MTVPVTIITVILIAAFILQVGLTFWFFRKYDRANGLRNAVGALGTSTWALLLQWAGLWS